MLIRFYKPYGVLCQFTPDGSGKPTLRDFLPIPDIYPAGRLDHDSEGLLLLTDDGPLQQRLSNPRFEHTKTYWVQVERIPTPQALQQLRDGVLIQGQRTLPAQAQLIPEPQLPPRHPPIRFRKNVPTAWLQLTLREGRNRQVRRMTAAIGHPTLRLIRSAIATYTLQGLQPGQYETEKKTKGLKPAIAAFEPNPSSDSCLLSSVFYLIHTFAGAEFCPPIDSTRFCAPDGVPGATAIATT